MFAAIMLLPDYFSSSLLNALENVLLIGTGCILLKYRYRPSKWMCVAFAYCILLVCSSYYNFTDKANYHFVISNLKIIILFAVLRVFFFQPVLAGKTDAEKSDHVGNELVQKASSAVQEDI